MTDLWLCDFDRIQAWLDDFLLMAYFITFKINPPSENINIKVLRVTRGHRGIFGFNREFHQIEKNVGLADSLTT